MSAAQMSLSVLRGGGAFAPPTAPRGAPVRSLLSGGSPDAALTSLSSPVSAGLHWRERHATILFVRQRRAG